MNVRQPAVAGMFYPADKTKLENNILTLLKLTESEKKFDNIVGIVSPHAGYVYSGLTAAHAYNLLKGKKYSTVIIISPSHREYFPGVSVFDGDAYETPLGIIPIDKEMREKLTRGSKIIFSGQQGHRGEHAVEVQIPFLQVVLKDFSILPVVMGDQGEMFIDELAKKIAEAANNDTLIVASSDLSHFYPREDADRLDGLVERRIKDFNFSQLQYDLENRTCEACGGGPIVAMMKAAGLMNIRKSTVLYRTDSGETTGDTGEVVGYLSAVIYGD